MIMQIRAATTFKQITLFIAIFLTLLVMGCGNKTAEEYIVEAKLALDSSDSTSATLILKSALAENPNHPQLRLMLAKIYIDEGNGPSAVKELNKARKHGSLNNFTNLYMLEALLLANDYEALIDFIDETEVENHTATADSFAFYRAWTCLELNDLERAATTVSKHKWSDSNMQMHASKLILSFTQNNLESIAELTTILSKPSKDLVTRYLLAGKINYTVGNFAESFSLLQRYYNERPKHIPGNMLFAKSALQVNEMAVAKEVITKLETMQSTDSEINLLVATYYLQQQDYSAALENASRNLVNHPNHVPSSIVAGISAFQLNDFDRAFFYLDPINELLNNDHISYRIYIATLIALNKNGKAFDLLSRLDLVNEPTVPLVSKVSLELAESGEFEKAESLLSLEQTNNISLVARYQQSVAQFLVSATKGLEMLNLLAEKHPDNPAIKLTLASALAKQSKFEQAEAIITEIKDEEFLKIPILNLQASVKLAQQKVQDAETLYRSILSIDEHSLNANTYFLIKAVKNDQLQLAETHSLNILAKEPAHAQTLAFYTYVMQRKGNSNQALAALERAVAEPTSDYTVKLLRIEILLKEGEYSEAMGSLDELYIASDEHEFRFWQLYSAAFLLTGDESGYIESLLQWKQAFPSSVEPYRRHAEHLMLKRQLDHAEKVVSAGLAISPNDIQLQMLELDIVLESKQLSLAEEKLHVLKQSAGESYLPALRGLEGKLDFFKGNLKDAWPKIIEYYEWKPSLHNAFLLRALLIRSNQYEDAKRFVLAHLEKYPRHHALRLYAGQALEREAPEKAKAQYLIMLENNDNNEQALLSLVKLLMKLGEHTLALKYSAKLVTLNEDEPKYLHLNGLALMNNEQYPLAQKRLQKAADLDTKNIPYRLDLVSAAIQNSDWETADSVLMSIKNPMPAFKLRIDELQTKIASNHDK